MRIRSIEPVYVDGIEDDWIRPLTEKEINERMHRVSGDCKCSECGNLYYDHPVETRVLGIEDRPYLHRLCNGWFGKL